MGFLEDMLDDGMKATRELETQGLRYEDARKLTVALPQFEAPGNEFERMTRRPPRKGDQRFHLMRHIPNRQVPRQAAFWVLMDDLNPMAMYRFNPDYTWEYVCHWVQVYIREALSREAQERNLSRQSEHIKL
jgi:hypothetical protein